MAILKLKDKDGNITEIPAIVGPPGKDGKSAYEYAQDGGYEGTEEEFMEMMASGSNVDGTTDDELLEMLIEEDTLPVVLDNDGFILSDEHGNIILW